MQKLIKSDRDGTFIISEIDRTFRNRIRKYIYTDIVILIIFMPFICRVYFMGGVFQGICHAGIFLTLNVGAVLLVSNIRIKKRNEFVKGFLQTDEEYYMKMCSQAERRGLIFRSFYMTDDYLFIPDDMIMIPFKAVRDVYADRTYLRRFPVKMFLIEVNIIFVDGRGNKMSAKIRDIRDFTDNEDSFMRNVRERISHAVR